MLEVKIERDGEVVKVNGVLCTLVRQATKGEGHEVVNIEKAVGCEYQKYLTLKNIPEGESTITINFRKEVASNKYSLTEEEKAQVADLQSQIDAIINAAKARYVAPVKKAMKDMNAEELTAYIANLQKLLDSKMGE